MRKIVIGFMFVLCLLGVSADGIHAVEENIPEKITVAYYEYEPYFYLDSKGDIRGLYHDIIQQYAKDIGFEVQYQLVEFAEGVELTKDGVIDLMMGVHFTEEREEGLLYSSLAIGKEEMAVYTKPPFTYGDLQGLSGKKIGLINDEENSKWLSKVLRSKNIEVEEVYVNSYHEVKQLLLLGKVDATIMSAYKNKTLRVKPIYHYSAGEVYMVVGEKNQSLLQAINAQSEKYLTSQFAPITTIYNNYLPGLENKTRKLINVHTILLSSLITMFVFYPKLKKMAIRKKIRGRLNRNEYMPYYQPIVQPHTNEVVGFEALLRLKHPKKGILSPYFFMGEIEAYHMLEEVTLWLVKQVMADYARISEFELVKNRHLYISLNLSTRELENQLFVQELIDLSKRSNIPSQGICLEVVEKFSISNIDHLKDGIGVLKQNGFKIAIDDFGVDYSNLKVLELLNFDVLKLDKYFADEMGKSKNVRYMIEFLASLTLNGGKSLVMEGIEDENQKAYIKSLGYSNVLIQGYYYAKPMPLDEIKDFSVKS
ncbi:MAG: EAL domain-containing protein [Turicibacter sp.]